jgi:hypothetical protein
VSTSGTSDYRLQIGAGSVDATGYTGFTKRFASTAFSSSAQVTNGLGLTLTTNSSVPYIGQIFLVTLGSNIWTITSSIWQTTNDDFCTAGTVKTLSGTLDRVRITTSSGTDTFDAGSINILYEG